MPCHQILQVDIHQDGCVGGDDVYLILDAVLRVHALWLVIILPALYARYVGI